MVLIFIITLQFIIELCAVYCAVHSMVIMLFVVHVQYMYAGCVGHGHAV